MPEETIELCAAIDPSTFAGNPPLHTIYFYYLKYASPHDDRPADMRVYHKLDKATPIINIEAEIALLAQNAIRDGNQPSCLGSDFRDLDRRRKSYFVIVTDGKDLQGPLPYYFIYNNNNPTDYTFSDAQHFTVPVTDSMGQTVRLTGGYCVNLMQSFVDRDDLDEREGEEFDLYLNFGGAQLYPDSGGTNMGPPMSPP